MKRKVLAVVIPTLMALAGTTHAAEIYNKDGNKLDLHFKVDGLHYISDNDNADGDHSYVRGGFSGETQITDMLTGYGMWEYQANLNHTEGEDNRNFSRFGFAGLKFGDYGSLDYGRNSGIIYDIMAWTDMQPEFDGSTVGADNFMFQRAGGVLTYHNRDFFGLVDGLNFGIQYQGKNDDPTENKDGRDVLSQNGDGYGLSLSYDLGYGFSLGGAYFQSDRTNDQNSGGKGGRYNDIMGNGDKAEAYTVGVKYENSGYYAAANYTQSYNAIRFGNSNDHNEAYGYANKAQGVEMYTGYTFDFGLQPFVGWNYVEGKDLGSNGASRDYGDQKLVNFIDIGATYFFNKNMSTYVDYKINMIDDNDFTRSAGIDTDDTVALGIVYQF